MNVDLINEVVDYLYGGSIDPREVRDIISKMNDSSEVHVKKPVGTEAALKKKKREVNIGLANNAFGAGAGAIATAQAYKVARHMDKKTMKTTRTGRMLLKSKINPKIAIPIAGGAGVGMQLANGAMDAQSAQYFARERINMQKKKVKKSLDEVIAKRRSGEITTDQAITVVDKKLTGLLGKVKLPKRKTIRVPKKQYQDMIDNSVKNSIDEGHKILPGVGLALGSAGAGAAGLTYYKDTKKNKQFTNAPPTSEFVAKDMTWTGEISKVDVDKQQVFGWCSLTHMDGEPVVDRQGDYIPLEEVEKSAYNYVVHSRKGGDMHKRDGDNPLHASDMIESFVVTPEKLSQMGLEENALPHGWWVGFKVNNEDLWEEVKKGDKIHFSIHGKGRRVEKDYDEVANVKKYFEPAVVTTPQPPSSPVVSQQTVGPQRPRNSRGRDTALVAGGGAAGVTGAGVYAGRKLKPHVKTAKKVVDTLREVNAIAGAVK